MITKTVDEKYSKKQQIRIFVHAQKNTIPYAKL